MYSYSIYKNMKLGDKGNEVKAIQMSLPTWSSNGSPLVLDGIFGKSTEDAVKRYQKEMRFNVDGIVGELTGKSLGIWIYVDEGIDCSHYQKVDYEKFSKENKNKSFAILKATEGKDYKDPMFMDHSIGFHSIGLSLGAYHFTKFKNSSFDEAMNFCQSIFNSSVFYDFVFLDLEHRDTDLSGIEIMSWTQDFLDIVSRSLGRKLISKKDVGIYTSSNYLREMKLQNYNWMKSYNLWACDWEDQPIVYPWDNWEFWQYSSKGSLAGIEGYVDLNLKKRRVIG